jgi:hypothetical protein
MVLFFRGLEAIPLSVDLWLAYLELYHKMYNTHENFPQLFRAQCEKAVATAGLDYRYSSNWDCNASNDFLTCRVPDPDPH